MDLTVDRTALSIASYGDGMFLNRVLEEYALLARLDETNSFKRALAQFNAEAGGS